MTDPRNRHLVFHRLRTSKEVEHFLATLAQDRTEADRTGGDRTEADRTEGERPGR
jgi:hypothetical protein